MRKVCLTLVILMLCLSACSASKPEITATTATDLDPVTGQRILLQVASTTDNPPSIYFWNASGGLLEDGGLTQYWAYWTAPQQPGRYTITCMIMDDAGENESFPFCVTVHARQDATSLLDDDENALSLASDTREKTGGIWAAVDGKKMHYFSATSRSSAAWGRDFVAMAVDKTQTSYYTAPANAFWGSLADSNSIITYTTAAGSLTCTTCEDDDTITSMTKDGAYLWVGTQSGLHGYNTSSATWMDKPLAHAVHAIDATPDYTCVATTSGVYLWDKDNDTSPSWIEPAGALADAACAATTDSDGNIWSVSADQVCIDGIPCAAQPDYVACSLATDLAGRVWCGTYCTTDGSAWLNPTGIDDSVDAIVHSVVSPEGLLYLKSAAGALYVWGKTP